MIHEICSLSPPFVSDSMEGLYNKIIKGKSEKLPSIYSAEVNKMISWMLNVKSELRPSCKEIIDNQLYQRIRASLYPKPIKGDTLSTKNLERSKKKRIEHIQINDFTEEQKEQENLVSDDKNKQYDLPTNVFHADTESFITRTNVVKHRLNDSGESKSSSNKNRINQKYYRQNNLQRADNLFLYDTIRVPVEINLNNFNKAGEYLPKPQYNSEQEFIPKVIKYDYSKSYVNYINLNDLKKKYESALSKRENDIREKIKQIRKNNEKKIIFGAAPQDNNSFLMCNLYNNIVQSMKPEKDRLHEIDELYKNILNEVVVEDPLNELRKKAKPYLYSKNQPESVESNSHNNDKTNPKYKFSVSNVNSYRERVINSGKNSSYHPSYNLRNSYSLKTREIGLIHNGPKQLAKSVAFKTDEKTPAKKCFTIEEERGFDHEIDMKESCFITKHGSASNLSNNTISEVEQV